MTTSDNIKLVLYNLSILEEDCQFIEEGDVTFLNEYFRHMNPIFSMHEILLHESNSYQNDIDNEMLESVAQSVRKVSKKSREAAKLYHILKKLNFKALFNCLKELNNDEHIPIPYSGEFYPIEIEFPRNDYVDNGQIHTESDEEVSVSEQSYESDITDTTENIIKANNNLPKYQDIGYNDTKEYSGSTEFEIISIKKDPKQPLGITVVKTPLLYEKGTIQKCVIERILVNSLIDKQGLLQAGDIIFEVNDEPIETAEELQNVLGRCRGTITFKILRTSKRPISNSANLEKTHVRALFDYDPSKDKLLPAEQIGFSFKAGDVFEVLNRDDPNFWQACPLDSTNNQAFLIPSQSLQERIIAIQKDLKPKSNENLGGKGKRRKSKKNEIFRAKDAADMVSEADLQTYEEVVKFGPSRVPCVLLIGPTGVGKKAIKHYLVQKEPHRFSFPLQDTSEAKKSRNQPLFNHVERNVMLSDIKASLYVCLEEKSGELYGIKSSAIRELINQGKTVVLDCQPKDVYSLKTPLFNPYVILISAPIFSTLEAMQKEGLQKNLTKNKRSSSELQEIIDQSEDFQNIYKHIINATVINDNIQYNASAISALLTEVESNSSWIPASWEFDITPLPTNNKLASNRPILKSADSTDGPTTQRRYEKKNMKPSVSIGSSKVIQANQFDNSASEESESESESNSEDILVNAKPIKYSASKKSNDNITIEDKPIKASISKKIEEVPMKKVDKPVKHSNSKVLEEIPKKDDKITIKHQNSHKNEDIPKKEDKSIKNSNSKKSEDIPKKEDKQLKSSHSKKTEDSATIKKDDRPIRSSNAKKEDEITIKNEERVKEIVTPAKRLSLQNKDNSKLLSNANKTNTKQPPIAPKPQIVGGNLNISVPHKTKMPELSHEESIKKSRHVSINQRSINTNERVQTTNKRMPIIKKENSSSEISDTSSESDRNIKENRV